MEKHEHEEHKEHGEKSEDEQASAYFAKEFNFSFEQLDCLIDFFDSLRDFAHHLTENHYYSESLNKSVADCTLELHSISLELNAVELEGREISVEATKAIAAAKSPNIDKSTFANFKKKFDNVRKKSLALHDSLFKLVDEIKREYKQKV